MSCPDQPDFTLNIMPSCWRDVDLAATRILHLPDGFAALTNHHTNAVAWDVDAVVDLLMRVVTPATAQFLDTDALLVAFHNFHNQVARVLLGRHASDQVDWSHAINTLVLCNNVHVAAT